MVCFFANLPPETVLELINTACGYSWSLPEMLRVGERGWTLKRAINHRLGLTRCNDRLPKALLQPYTQAQGGSLGYAPPFDAMLQAYYAARGWDADTGRPLPEKLQELGIDWALVDLWGGA